MCLCCDFGPWFGACLGARMDAGTYQWELGVRCVFGCVYRLMGACGSVRVWVRVLVRVWVRIGVEDREGKERERRQSRLQDGRRRETCFIFV